MSLLKQVVLVELDRPRGFLGNRSCVLLQVRHRCLHSKVTDCGILSLHSYLAELRILSLRLKLVNLRILC